MGKIKILHPKKHLVSNGYHGLRQQEAGEPWPCLRDMSCVAVNRLDCTAYVLLSS